MHTCSRVVADVAATREASFHGHSTSFVRPKADGKQNAGDDDDEDDDDGRTAHARPFCSSTTRRPSCRRTSRTSMSAPAGQLEAAKATCKEREHKFIPSMACLIDVGFGGKGFAAEG